MHGMSEYLMALAGLEEARLADRARKENLPRPEARHPRGAGASSR